MSRATSGATSPRSTKPAGSLRASAARADPAAPPITTAPTTTAHLRAIAIIIRDDCQFTWHAYTGLGRGSSRRLRDEEVRQRSGTALADLVSSDVERRVRAPADQRSGPPGGETLPAAGRRKVEAPGDDPAPVHRERLGHARRALRDEPGLWLQAQRRTDQRRRLHTRRGLRRSGGRQRQRRQPGGDGHGL